MVAEVLGLVPEKWVAFSTLVFPPLAFPARLVGRGVLFFPTILALLLAPLGRGIILETVLDGRGLVSLKWVIISTPLILPAVRFLITYWLKMVPKWSPKVPKWSQLGAKRCPNGALGSNFVTLP